MPDRKKSKGRWRSSILFAFFLKDAASKYKLKVKDGNTEVDETIEIDTEKQTEKFHIPNTGNTSDTAPGEVDVVYDFKLVSIGGQAWVG